MDGNGMNPYTSRAAVRGMSHFIGRQNVIDAILKQVEMRQSVNLVGAHKIGKTSILLRIHDVLAGKSLSGVIPISLNLQSFLDPSPKAVFDFLLSEMSKVSDYGSSAVKDPMKRIEWLLDEAERRDHCFCVLIDEFDVSKSEGFSPHYFSALRSLVNHPASSFIICSTLSVSEIEREVRLRENANESSSLRSEFQSRSSYMRLHAFLEEEALELIEGPSRLAGRPLAPYADFLLQLAGTHPYLLQLGCYLVFEDLERKPILDTADLRAVARKFVEDTQEYLEDTWGDLQKDPRFASMDFRIPLANLTPEGSHPITTTELQNRGLLIFGNSSIPIYSTIVQRFILRQPDLPGTGSFANTPKNSASEQNSSALPQSDERLGDGNRVPKPDYAPDYRKTIRAMRSRSPWKTGSFYLLVLLIALVMLILASREASTFAFPLILIGAILAVVVIGILQLRHDKRIKSDQFKELMSQSLHILPKSEVNERSQEDSEA